MKLIDPKQLSIPRVYFTEFDRITYSQVAWTSQDVDDLKLSLERKVKLLGLIKGIVVIATSHLFESELAQEFITENPVVLEKGILVPALISKYKTFGEFLSAKRTSSKEREMYQKKKINEINSLLSNTVDIAVKWDLDQTAGWFKNRLVDDLLLEKSTLRCNLSEIPISTISEIASRIRELERPSRGEIYNIAKGSGDDRLWKCLSCYTDLIYYLSGARAVNSEGVLPQENLIDCDINCLDRPKPSLSDYEIFYRIFLTIVENKTQKFFPVQILDLLTFDDIVELRENLHHTPFIQKYNALLERTKERIEITDTERLILSASELDQFADELQLIFAEAINREVYQRNTLEKQKQGTKVLASIASLIPFYGTPESIIQITINILSFLGFESRIQTVQMKIERNFLRLRQLAENGSFDNRPILLRFLQEITKKYSSKLQE